MLDAAALTLFAVWCDRLDIPVLPALIGAYFRSNREDALYRIASRQREPFTAINRVLSEIIMPDLARNRADLRQEGVL